MCTVSFIPQKEKILIAHSRDEKNNREKGTAPGQYIINGYTLLCPRDKAAGGSWIACHQDGAVAVLLNGAFEKHQQRTAYRKSRGLVFLDIVASSDLYLACKRVDLTNVEPFTLVLWAGDRLFECRWDGVKKHISELSAAAAHIWSSVTLYDAAIAFKRKKWFEAWLQLHPFPSIEELVQFHLFAGDGDPDNNLRINRTGFLLTVSITAIEIAKDKFMMQYLDLPAEDKSVRELQFTKAALIQQ
jgi:hypothetical protein